MKKATILTLITLCILSFASCGKQETTSGNESITATVESAQAETTVPEETETEESKRCHSLDSTLKFRNTSGVKSSL